MSRNKRPAVDDVREASEDPRIIKRMRFHEGPTFVLVRYKNVNTTRRKVSADVAAPGLLQSVTTAATHPSAEHCPIAPAEATVEETVRLPVPAAPERIIETAEAAASTHSTDSVVPSVSSMPVAPRLVASRRKPIAPVTLRKPRASHLRQQPHDLPRKV